MVTYGDSGVQLNMVVNYWWWEKLVGGFAFAAIESEFQNVKLRQKARKEKVLQQAS